MINCSLRVDTCGISIIFYCYMLQNKQSHRHSLGSVMSQVVIFAYRIINNLINISLVKVNLTVVKIVLF